MVPDFKYMMSKKYRTWRMLHSHHNWVEPYRARLRDIMDYRSAIVFPEQMFCFNEAYQVTAVCSAGSATAMVNIVSITNLYPNYAGSYISTYTEYESFHALEEICQTNSLKISNNSLPFFQSALFGNKKDAVKYGCRALEKFG